MGILNSASPTQIGGLNVSMSGIPAGQSFQVGDLVGQDLGASGGDRTWEYDLTLPGNAMVGTGLTNISFTGIAFENSANNLESSDQLSWQLFLNGSLIPVSTASPGAGVDFNSYNVNLANQGGPLVTSARVVFTITSFDGNNEWFATRGTLSAQYSAIPESAQLPLAGSLVALTFTAFRRGKRRRIAGTS